LRVVTETGAVARTMIKLCHELFDLETPLTVRRSNLHRTHNFMIEISEQEGLEAALVRMGILLPKRGLAPGAPTNLLDSRETQLAYLRGAFMAGGFVSDPRGDFHLEMALSGEQLATDICALAATLGVHARVNHRRGAQVVYLKRFEQIALFLKTIGAVQHTAIITQVRHEKTVKNIVNRQVNAELANSNRASGAAGDQMLLVEEAQRTLGLRALPPTLREFCLLRRANPELSLSALGALCDPPVGKSAMHHRAMRLEALLQQAARDE
jgi:DNA-binding protein WhiA